jgi:hypothetical protein
MYIFPILIGESHFILKANSYKNEAIIDKQSSIHEILWYLSAEIL